MSVLLSFDFEVLSLSKSALSLLDSDINHLFVELLKITNTTSYSPLFADISPNISHRSVAVTFAGTSQI
jgi:hypothetical protein